MYLESCGFILIFKETISTGNRIKGNCDAELVLKCVSDFYTKSFDSCLILTGDGDFACLIEFLLKNNALQRVIIPNENAYSALLKNKNAPLAFLNGHYKKFSQSFDDNVVSIK